MPTDLHWSPPARCAGHRPRGRRPCGPGGWQGGPRLQAAPPCAQEPGPSGACERDSWSPLSRIPGPRRHTALSSRACSHLRGLSPAGRAGLGTGLRARPPGWLQADSPPCSQDRKGQDSGTRAGPGRAALLLSACRVRAAGAGLAAARSRRRGARRGGLAAHTV